MCRAYVGLENTSRIIGPILFYLINCVTVFKKNAVTREYSRFQNRPMHAPSRIYDTKPIHLNVIYSYLM